MSENPQPDRTEDAPDESQQTGQEQAKPEDFEDDPSRNPDDEALKDIKGG
jgi:hypothetical protein